MAQITAADVEALEAELVTAKSKKGTAKSGAKVDAYMATAKKVADTRRAFREQEEQAGRRQAAGPVSTTDNDAQEG